MDAFLIEGLRPLTGRVEVSGSKNAALPLLFATILCDGVFQFEHMPRLWDIETALAILTALGSHCFWDKEKGTVHIESHIRLQRAPYDLVRKMRASVLVLGPLLARFGHAEVSLPGGCAIGARPVDRHLKALETMGAHMDVSGGYIVAHAPHGLKGSTVSLGGETVTGTENLLMAACLAKGPTLLLPAAREPEVAALAELLVRCGADISGMGSTQLRIVPPARLVPPSQPMSIPPDRIEAATFLVAGAVTRGEVSVERCPIEELHSIRTVLSASGVLLKQNGDTLTVSTPQKLEPPPYVTTAPYPGFPTDMQAQLTTLCTQIEGKSVVRETIFENRFQHAAELRRLGAHISVRGQEATIHGGFQLKGAPLMATDLRASASLVLAGLVAQGETLVRRIYHLDRGYQRMDEKLQHLGAKIKRIPSDA